MPHTHVTEIELRDDGTLALTVEVFGFEVGTPVEISGNASQLNGAIATFYHLQNLPAAGPGGGSLLTVTSAPAAKFAAAEMITVVGRATKIWGSVLRADAAG